MSQPAKLIVAFGFGSLYFGIAVDYFPATSLGFVLSAILFLTAIYPLYRVAGAGTDRSFILRGCAFVVITLVAHLVKPWLPIDVIRYSGSAVLLVAVGGALLSRFLGGRSA